MNIAVFDDSLLDPQRDTDNLASVDPSVWIINLFQEKEFRHLSDPSHETPTEYPRNYGHLNSPLSGEIPHKIFKATLCSWLPYSPYPPSLDHSSPGSSQDYSGYDRPSNN
ncbi:hypothetical protein CLU79DRAFT_718776 [Phycomyces nitens]|nr:hypothetical protein CLU79DRAFT_718776 [Phycomyces nitens]